MRSSIWQSDWWPQFQYDAGRLAPAIEAASFAVGRVAGAVATLGGADRESLARDKLAITARDTSQIEGERLNAESIRASLTRRLERKAPNGEPRVDGVVALTVDAVDNASEPFDRTRMFRWHRLLLADAPRSITIGAWRPLDGQPMVVESGPAGNRAVHFEAPHADRIDTEMRMFFQWFDEQTVSQTTPAIVFAALAHLRFLTVHPFDDGNGRIARAIADLILARARPEAARYLSLSNQILAERPHYYDALEAAQRGGQDVTAWIIWFAACYQRAAERTVHTLDETASAARFWSDHAAISFNARQRIVLERYLGGGFDGWINSSKYAALAKTSQDTAARDIADLVDKGILIANPGKARKTSYRITAS